ncbi:MAG: phospho-sugar mutase, partial [Anaerovorax sp.]
EGCQMTLDAAAEVFSLIQKVDIFKDVKLGTEKPTPIPKEVADKFLEAVAAESTGISCENLSLVYTPLNGAGNKPVRQILEKIGMGHVTLVKEQENPDGNFTTCPYPNPEKEEALHLGLALCNEMNQEGDGPDLLLATDPDCDRVGVAVKQLVRSTPLEKGGREGVSFKSQYQLLTGNEVGVLLLDFICQRRQEAANGIGKAKPMPKNPIAIKTIVSSKMADAVAAQYGVEMRDVLTGFKFIGEQIGILEKKGEEARYIFGFEESYGYLSGAYVRDKDAVNGSMLICQMASFYKMEGKTLADRLEELYQTYGYYQNDLMDFAFEGAPGMEKMAQIMADFRKNPPAEMIGKQVVKSVDYSLPTDLPKADVVEYVLEDGSSFMVRPSGTEPKLKIYLSAKGQTGEESEQIIENLKIQLKERIHAI